MTPVPEEIFVDGGVHLRNPSNSGGMWAWCWVTGGVRTRLESGAVRPADIGMDSLSNNTTEMLAALFALQSVPEGWAGTLFTDSNVTRHRLEGGGDLSTLPGWMRDDLRAVRLGRKWRVVLIAGHPSRAQLLAGYKDKPSGRLAVSEHNVACDEACNEAAERYLSNG